MPIYMIICLDSADGCVEWFFRWDEDDRCYKPVGRIPKEYEYNTYFFM